VVEGAYGEDLGVPVMECCALCERELARWETFHASSTYGIRYSSFVTPGDKRTAV